MRYTNSNLPICDGCSFAEGFYCKKFSQECLTFNEDETAHQIPCLQCLDQDSYQAQEVKPQGVFDSSSFEKAYFHIPDFSILNTAIHIQTLQNKYPYVFYPNRVILEVYDAFPGCYWNGRSTLFGKPFLSIQEINEIKEKAEQHEIGINLTWNNHLIKTEDLNDRFCNIITELFHNSQHSITVSSKELYQYLKEHYPNFNYYQSVIATSFNNEVDLSQDFDMYLAPITYNNNEEKLSSIPISKRSTIEFLCNDNCFPLCKKNEHYGIVNYCLKNFARESCIFKHECPIDDKFSFYNTKHWPTTINPIDIDFYLEQGYSHFKLAGRGEQFPILLNRVLKYFVKPEFFDDIYFQLLGGDSNYSK